MLSGKQHIADNKSKKSHADKNLEVKAYYITLTKAKHLSFEDRINLYQRLIQLSPNERNDLYYLKIAELYIQIANIEQALVAYASAILSNPKNPILLLKRGHAYLTKGNLYRALDDYQSALKLKHNLLPLLKCKKKIIFEIISKLPDVEEKQFLIDYLDETTTLGKIARISRKGIACDENRGTLKIARERLNQIYEKEQFLKSKHSHLKLFSPRPTTNKVLDEDYSSKYFPL